MGIVLRDSFRITIVSYVGAAIGYLNKVFLFTNFLSTEQVGLANLLITISVIYAQVGAMGSYNIILRFFPFFNNREKGYHSFLPGMMLFSLAGFALTTLAFIAFLKPFTLIYQDSAPLLTEHVMFVIPLALATMTYHLFEAYLRSLRKNVVPSLIYDLGLRLFVTLSILAFAIGWVDFRQFVTIYVIANCLPALVILAYTHLIKELFLRFTITPMIRRLGRIVLVYGLFSLLNNLSIMLLSSIDSLMVAGMIDLGAAGIYTTMIFITSVMMIPYRNMIKVSGPLVATYWRAKAMHEMQDLYRKATAANLVTGAGIFLLIWVNLDSIFAMIPGDYAAGRFVFLFLSIGKLFDMAAGLNGTILLTSKKYRYDLLFTIGLVVVAVISNLMLIPVLGINGAAIASMLTMIIFNLLRILFVKIHFSLQPFSLRDIYVPLIVMAIMTASSATGQAPHVLIDIPIRSSLAALAFIIPVYALKVSPGFNSLVDQYKKLILK